ncbi:MAG: putative glycoside hydrolase, partial [Patescibacteria group bacterium]
KDHLAGTGVVISADLFGMTTTNTDDLNIGQVLERTLPYFDYIAPMVYPSHYPKTFLGFSNPAEKPYEVIKYSLDSAVTRASTTPQKIRPWLQDFDLGAVYTKEMVRAQIQATYDAGLTSWMLWDAANTYTRGALLPE